MPLYNSVTMNKIRYVLILLCIGIIASCHHRGSDVQDIAKPTPSQEKLLENGWIVETPPEDLSEEYGIHPIHGIQDNYFDIAIGEGCNVAVKIMDLRTDKCIRYVYVAENSTTTVQEIPQGIYYLKLAYGYDWMSYEINGKKTGKFTRNVSYERSQDTFDFGEKNSMQERNYSLEINVTNSKLENNFLTVQIDEEEFLK